MSSQTVMFLLDKSRNIGVDVIITGWGFLNYDKIGASMAKKLQKVTVSTQYDL